MDMFNSLQQPHKVCNPLQNTEDLSARDNESIYCGKGSKEMKINNRNK